MAKIRFNLPTLEETSKKRKEIDTLANVTVKKVFKSIPHFAKAEFEIDKFKRQIYVWLFELQRVMIIAAPMTEGFTQIDLGEATVNDLYLETKAKAFAGTLNERPGPWKITVEGGTHIYLRLTYKLKNT